jgi:hypothetical protein
MTNNQPPQSITDTIKINPSMELIDALQSKMRQLVEDFASGRINRTQFHGLYDRYQRQMTQIMRFNSVTSEGSEDTLHIKKRLTAKVLGFSIYNNQSGLPIETIGEFVVDTALLVPMLSSYRAATREIFKAGMRSTVMENDQWLCFVPGNLTTLIALFSVEPSSVQLGTVERMHRDFEDANQAALEKGNIDPNALAYPFLTFVRQAHNKHTGTYPAADS